MKFLKDYLTYICLIYFGLGKFSVYIWSMLVSASIFTGYFTSTTQGIVFGIFAFFILPLIDCITNDKACE